MAKIKSFTPALLLIPSAAIHAADVPTAKPQATATIVTGTPSAGDSSASAINAFEQSLRKKLDAAEKPNLSGRFKADFESLKQYKLPDWYQDAKFGVFIHWGIFSVPATNDCWHGYWMYRDRDDLPVNHQVANRKMTLAFPDVSAAQRTCKYAWVLKMGGFEIE
jgi:hypothetical protein